MLKSRKTKKHWILIENFSYSFNLSFYCSFNFQSLTRKENSIKNACTFMILKASSLVNSTISNWAFNFCRKISIALQLQFPCLDKGIYHQIASPRSNKGYIKLINALPLFNVPMLYHWTIVTMFLHKYLLIINK